MSGDDLRRADPGRSQAGVRIVGEAGTEHLSTLTSRSLRWSAFQGQHGEPDSDNSNDVFRPELVASGLSLSAVSMATPQSRIGGSFHQAELKTSPSCHPLHGRVPKPQPAR